MVVGAPIVFKREEFDIEAFFVGLSNLEELFKLFLHLFELVKSFLFHDWVMKVVQLLFCPSCWHIRNRGDLKVPMPEAILAFAHLMERVKDH